MSAQSGKTELRRLASGGVVTPEVLQSFLLAQVNHDVLADHVLEQVVAEVRAGTIDPDALANDLAAMVSEVSVLVKPSDWRAAAVLVIAEARSLLEEEPEVG